VLGRDELQHVRQQKTDPLARRHAQRAEPIGDPIGPLLHLPVADSAVAVADRRPLGVIQARPVEDLRQRSPHRHDLQKVSGI